MAMCLSVSVTNRSSIKTAERIELIVGIGAFFDLSYTVLKRNPIISKNKGTSLPNAGLEKIRYGIIRPYRSSIRVID